MSGHPTFRDTLGLDGRTDQNDSDPVDPATSSTSSRRQVSGLRKWQFGFTDQHSRRNRRSAKASEVRGRLAERLKQVEEAAARLEHELREGADPATNQPPEDASTAAPRPSPPSTMADLRVELSSAQAQLRAEIEARDSERVTWQAARLELEQSLRDSRAQLRQVAETHASERTAWETTVQELRGSAESAWAGLRQTRDTHAVELTDRDIARQMLELALNNARAELAETSHALGIEQTAHGAVRVALSTAQEQLESHVARLVASEKMRREIEAALAESQRAQHDWDGILKMATDARASDRAAWEAARERLLADHAEQLALATKRHEAELEERARSLQDAIDAKVRLEGALADAARTVAAREQQLAARESQLQEAVAARSALEVAANGARAEFDRAAAVHAADRIAGARALQEANDAAASAEEALAESELTRRRLIEDHAAAEAAWIVAKEDLAARAARAEPLERTCAALEQALAESKRDFQQLAEERNGAHAVLAERARHLETVIEEREATARQTAAAHAAAEAAWNDARGGLERDCERLRADVSRAAEELTRTRSELEAELRSRADALKQMNDAKTALEGTVVESARRIAAHEAEIEARNTHVREAAAAYAALEAQLNAARADLEREVRDVREAQLRAAEAHAADQTAWASTRQELEREAREARVARERSAEMHVADQAAWAAARQEFERELREARDARQRAVEMRAADHAAWASNREELEREARESRVAYERAAEAHAVDQTAWASARQELERQLERAQAVELDREYLQQALEAADARCAELSSGQAVAEARWRETAAALRQVSAESEEFRRGIEAEFQGGELQERLREARRLEEVGRLAGAMTPEMVGLVESIDRYAQDLVRAIDGADPGQLPAREILASSARASVLIRQLLTFSERQSRAVAPLDLNEVLRQLEPALAQLAGAAIDVQVELGPAGEIAALTEDVEHLLTTLVFSAREVLPLGGTLEIRTGEESGASDLDLLDGRAGRQALLTVEASGFGIQAPEGSPALEIIVQRCGGDFFLDGITDQNVVFQVRFPMAAEN